jgi:hypothetical protein
MKMVLRLFVKKEFFSESAQLNPKRLVYCAIEFQFDALHFVFLKLEFVEVEQATATADLFIFFTETKIKQASLWCLVFLLILIEKARLVASCSSGRI